MITEMKIVGTVDSQSSAAALARIIAGHCTSDEMRIRVAAALLTSITLREDLSLDALAAFVSTLIVRYMVSSGEQS